MARRASRTTPNYNQRLPYDTAVTCVKKKPSGFTIIELLIVIVVIAILATITIIAYNGITNRSKASVTASAVQQVAKKILAHAVINADQYPAALRDIGISDANSTTYQYRAENDSTPRTFCVSASNGNSTYHMTQRSVSPSEGSCPDLITNLANNPSVESSPWTICAYCSVSRVPGNIAGSYVARVQVTTAGTSYLYVGATADIPITAGQTIAASATVKNVTGGTRPFSLAIVWRDAARATIGSAPISTTQNLDVGATTTLNVTGTAPSGVSYLQIQARSTSAQVSDVYEWDGVMVVTGSTPRAFADGNTPEWIWNGAVNGSTSTGPSL